MSADLTTRVGAVTLKNPLIAAAAEHLIDAAGVRRAVAAGAGAVVVKSTNEREGGKDQLQRAEYAVLDDQWRPVPWDAAAPMSATIATRSGLTPQDFDIWLEQTARLDHEAAKSDSYAVASLILSDLDEACRMGKLIEQAGIRVLEFNIGTPYASVTTKGNVTTEFDPARVSVMVSSMRRAIKLPLWIKLTGQSERVPDLARAAFDARGFGRDGRAPARVHSGRGDAGADARHESGRRRLLEFADDLSLACEHARRTGQGQAADRHQWRAERPRYRAHDALGCVRRRHGLAGDAARI
jgi:hypothetical protein